MSKRASRLRRLGALFGKTILLSITSSSVLTVLFILGYVFKDAMPFFEIRGFGEFFTSARWYPSQTPPEFGALSMFVGSALVTAGAATMAVPLGIAAAVCLSDVLPFGLRQTVKPVIEILAAIPSVAYGFFALVIFAPLLQENGGTLLAFATWLLGVPILGLVVYVLSDLTAARVGERTQGPARALFALTLGGLAVWALHALAGHVGTIRIDSGTNALNVSVILGIMALPTVVSVSEDALQSVGREMREGSYALGATRAETVLRVVLPAASSGICAAIILGVMRAIGETMVVWMASGNAAQIPAPWYNLLQPVRTMTATIAGEMGEADHVTGSARYHVLFAMALCLLLFSLICNLVSEWIMKRQRRKMGGV